ncbi:acyltransferase family protein [uncultured Clostridium sp.]|uniref:acyltransferase family protein n=1 Tax=uncultured Clostridium sp. TaxID=59620 RepID=UPI0028E61F52|nr:acyltransferase family protein [uncultured Clostridium sp.]
MTKNSKEFTFDKHSSQTIKGIAIIMMVFHHFFGFPKWIIYPNEYTSMGLTLGNAPIEVTIALFFKICVGMYLFITGYGMYYFYKSNYILKRTLEKIFKFLLNYWIILFLIFIPIKIYFNKFNFNLEEILLNMFAYKTTYITFAWYVRLYIELMILFPLFVKIIKDKFIYAIIYSIFPFILINIFIVEYSYEKISIFKYIYEFCNWAPIALVGYNFAKFNIFRYMKKKLVELNLDNIFIYNWICIIIFIARTYKKSFGVFNLDIIYVPIFIYFIINIINSININKINKSFAFLSQHSLNIWFLHAMFFMGIYKIQQAGYFFKLPILIVSWVFIFLIPLSCIINVIVSKIWKKIKIAKL